MSPKIANPRRIATAKATRKKPAKASTAARPAKSAARKGADPAKAPARRKPAAPRATPRRKAARRAAPRRPAAPKSPRFPSLLTYAGRIPIVPQPQGVAPGERSSFDPERELRREAMRWTYIVRNRRRWANVESFAKNQAAEAQKLAASLGLSNQLRALADTELAQVVVPYVAEEIGWESRVMPWEFVLSAATRAFRGKSVLTIVRQLELADSPKAPPARVPKRVLYVESEPGALQGLFSFRSERELIRLNLTDGAAKEGSTLEWRELRRPTRAQLSDTIAAFKPDIVHLAGFDSHQGFQLLGANGPAADSESPLGRVDGYLVRAEDAEGERTIDNITATELGAVLTAGGARPQLVSLSLWNSASRIAPMLVASGVEAVVAFQDSFSDELIELFFASFYRRYRVSNWNLAEAFRSAFLVLKDQPQGLLGTCLVLWSNAPLVEMRTAVQATTALASQQQLEKLLAKETSVRLDPKSVAPEQIGGYLSANVKALAQLNYSLLHNRRPMFETFELVKLRPGHADGIEVTVDLYVGEVSFPWRRTLTLAQDKIELRGEIHSTLTGAVLRAVREPVMSSVFVEVRWGEHVLHRNSHRVCLLPPDLWRDSKEDRRWLPCFVLPRDPAVVELIEAAQRYVRVLRDDPAAGFDGYQSVDPERDDPTEDVDLQVRAIWSAIQHEWRPGYINPPPSYSRELDSQRLRTPSMVRSESAGTCIDLALLLAASLELVDIYPVIFLLDGHAFPGYWRSADAHENFLEMNTRDVADFARADAQISSVAGSREEEWVFGSSAYDEILRRISDGDLVPLETVWLTTNQGFWDAVETGSQNLKPRREFQLMVDVARARLGFVTPLPLWGNQT